MPKNTTTLTVTLTQKFDVEIDSFEELNHTVNEEVEQMLQNGTGLDYKWERKEGI